MGFFKLLFKLAFLALLTVAIAYLFLAIFYFGTVSPSFKLAQPMDVFNRFFSKEALDTVTTSGVGATVTAPKAAAASQSHALILAAEQVANNANKLDPRFPIDGSLFSQIPGYVDFLKKPNIPAFLEKVGPYLTKYIIPLGMALVSGLIGALIINFILSKITRAIIKKRRKAKRAQQSRDDDYYYDEAPRRRRR